MMFLKNVVSPDKHPQNSPGSFYLVEEAEDADHLP